MSARSIKSPRLRRETLDAISNPDTCVKHRAGMTEADKGQILKRLIDDQLVDPSDGAQFPGGLEAGVFPPVVDEGSQCPRLRQPFSAAPGSYFGGHHSYPGGLAIHEANNEIASTNLAAEYRRVYGNSSSGFPSLRSGLLAAPSGGTDVSIDQDIIVAAPIWHDWAKSIVFQWNEDGSEFPELNLGGNGETDNYKAQGNSKTGTHHILSLAEAMARRMDPILVVTMASAHSAPSNGNEFKVVNWLRAAAVIAQVDPIEMGYLTKDKQGHLRLPPFRRLADLDLMDATPPQTNLLAEYTIHNLSDADYNYSMPAVTSVEILLRRLAPAFGVDTADTASYNNRFRNPILTFSPAERLLMIYSKRGTNGVRLELQRLRKHKVF
jgi:hypothetical protein